MNTSVSISRSATVPLVATRDPGLRQGAEGRRRRGGRIGRSIGQVAVDRLPYQLGQGPLLAAPPLVEPAALLDRQVDLGPSRRHIQRSIHRRSAQPFPGTSGFLESTPGSLSASCCGWDGAAYAEPWPRSGGCARG